MSQTYITIPDQFEILNGKYKRQVLKRGFKCYIIEEKGCGRTKIIVLQKRLRGLLELLSDYQTYKLATDKDQAEELFRQVEAGEIEF